MFCSPDAQVGRAGTSVRAETKPLQKETYLWAWCSFWLRYAFRHENKTEPRMVVAGAGCLGHCRLQRNQRYQIHFTAGLPPSRLAHPKYSSRARQPGECPCPPVLGWTAGPAAFELTTQRKRASDCQGQIQANSWNGREQKCCIHLSTRKQSARMIVAGNAPINNPSGEIPSGK